MTSNASSDGITEGPELPDLTDSTEARAQEKGREIGLVLAQTRRILDSDDLASLVAPRAHYEQSFEGLGYHFFSIDGVLRGSKITGALFAGECILVHAPTVLAAQELANQGLRETVHLLEEEYRTRGERDPVQKGLITEVGGGRYREGGPGLERLPELRRLMDIIIGGKPE